MSEGEQLPGMDRILVRNPVSPLGIISFCGGLGSFLLCGFFVIVSAFYSGRYSNPIAQMQNISIIGTVAFLLSIIVSFTGFITGIVGVAIRRGEKLEGRGFAIAGLVMSGAYLLIIMVIVIITMLMLMTIGSWIDSLG